MANEVKVDLNEMERISDGTEQAGGFCRTIHSNLRNRFTGLVPDQWEGEAATAFSQDMEATLKAIDKLAQVLEQAPATIERMMRKLAEGHSQSKKYVQDAGQAFVGGAGGSGAAPTGSS